LQDTRFFDIAEKIAMIFYKKLWLLQNNKFLKKIVAKTLQNSPKQQKNKAFLLEKCLVNRLGGIGLEPTTPCMSSIYCIFYRYF